MMLKGGRGLPFIFHLADSQTDGTDRIRKRHLIRRRGHFTFRLSAHLSVHPCVASLFSRSRFLHRRPTNQSRHVRTPPPRIDHATRAEITRRRTNRGDFFFSPDIPRPQSALQLELADEWYLRGRGGKGTNRQKDPRMGMILRHGTIYG